MIANVSTLLRDFTKVRRTVLAGEDVIIKTKEGTIRLTADKPAGFSVLGKGRNLITHIDDGIDEPTTTPGEWGPRE